MPLYTARTSQAVFSRERIGRRDESSRRHARRGVGAYRPAEQQDVRLGLVNLVVHPTPGLLHTDIAPFLQLS